MRSPPPNYGRFDSEQKALQAVVQRLVDALHPLSIYLFGSRAEGRARPDSDFDLVVVLDDEAPNSDADYDELYRPSRMSSSSDDFDDEPEDLDHWRRPS